MKTIIQLGSTRDGLEPYKERAQAHGMECVLVEIPEYLKLREKLGRQKFEKTITVEHPENPDEVVDAIKKSGISPYAIIAGFEIYNYSAYAVAKTLNTLPYDTTNTFQPFTKIQQRNILKEINSRLVLQPQFLELDDLKISPEELSHLEYPLILKPVDGGSGLGTFVVKNYASLEKALVDLKNIKNYGGAEFQGFMIEEYVPGHEYSVQGFVRDEEVTILTLGKKFIFTEKTYDNENNSHVFRESGIMLLSGEYIDEEIKEFVQTCVDAFKYKHGAFHIDIKLNDDKYYFLEMGFRVSGLGITKLVNQVSGYNWAEETFTSLLRIPSRVPKNPVKNHCIGQIRARLESEMQKAKELAKTNKNITIEEVIIPTVELISKRLKSDINRHAGTLGRVTVEGETLEEVENLLRKCVFERLPYRVE